MPPRDCWTSFASSGKLSACDLTAVRSLIKIAVILFNEKRAKQQQKDTNFRFTQSPQRAPLETQRLTPAWAWDRATIFLCRKTFSFYFMTRLSVHSKYFKKNTFRPYPELRGLGDDVNEHIDAERYTNSLRKIIARMKTEPYTWAMRLHTPTRANERLT